MPDTFLKTGLRSIVRATRRSSILQRADARPHKTPSQSSHVLIACFPKSGSTYLCKVLADLTGMQRTNFAQAREHGWYAEQDLYERTLRAHRRTPAIVHQHVQGTPPNVHLLKQYGIRPVILVRDIADTLLSLHDHLDREGPAVPTGYVPRHYFNMRHDERLTYLIRMHLPWYFHFLVSWQDAASDIPQKWISYEQLFADRVTTIHEVCDHVGLEVTTAEIQQSLATLDADADATRKNVAKAGRGASLPEEHRQAICELADCWGLGPHAFEHLGLRKWAPESRDCSTVEGTSAVVRRSYDQPSASGSV